MRDSESRPTRTGVKIPDDSSTVKIKGFVAGTFSGLTKLAVGHPFDGIKVRMQCSPAGTYKGAMDCLLQLLRKEGPLALYKGALAPALTWSVTDSVLMGSLHNYRLFFRRWTNAKEGEPLKVRYHAAAGLLAGWTNSFLTAPVEVVKTRLQMQAHRIQLHLPGSSSSPVPGRQYTGPFDCAAQIIRQKGVRGLWYALPATMIFRSWFGVMFAAFEVLQVQFASLQGTRFEVSQGTATFLSGGLAAQLYWTGAFPSDTVKNRIMASPSKYPSYWYTVRAIFAENNPDGRFFRGFLQFYRGFLPCILRAFPTNASALLAFETAMRLLGDKTSHR